VIVHARLPAGWGSPQLMSKSAGLPLSFERLLSITTSSLYFPVLIGTVFRIGIDWSGGSVH